MNKKISSIFKLVIVPFHELTEIKFYNILMLNLQLRSTNSIMFQYTSYTDSQQYMLGPQVGVVVKDSHNISYYRNLYEHFNETLNLLMERYFIDYPEFIVFRFRILQVEEDTQVMKKNFSTLNFNKKVLKLGEIKKSFNGNILPFTFNEKHFGNLLEGNLREKYLSELIALLVQNPMPFYNTKEGLRSSLRTP
uniref:DNA polymerase n=1 Tax=Termitomyces sp. TaxID=1916073 RepID=A0A386TYD0_9AGAR|nr:LAGLIDADG homing endonuclease [Termitomyces sp.]AYE93255.1 DNA polymerase [Termitomyces sp.]